jgi:hypothetical protein
MVGMADGGVEGEAEGAPAVALGRAEGVPVAEDCAGEEVAPGSVSLGSRSERSISAVSKAASSSSSPAQLSNNAIEGTKHRALKIGVKRENFI